MKTIKTLLTMRAATLAAATAFTFLAALTGCTADEVTNPTAGNPADAVGISTTVSNTVVTDTPQADARTFAIIKAATTRADATATEPYLPGFSGATLTLFYGSLSADDKSKATYTYTTAIAPGTEGKWSTTAPLYWNNLDAINTAATGEAATMEYPFFAAAPQVPAAAPAVAANQSNKETGYTPSDQLIAYTATTQRRTDVALTMRHVLSQITVGITAATTDGTTPDIPDAHIADATLTIAGAKIAYTLTYNKDALNPAVATATGNAATITPLRTTAEDATTATASFAAIVPTQTFAARALVLNFTINNKVYTWTNPQEIALATGTRTHIDITARHSSVLVGSVSVADWDPGTTASGSINTDNVQPDGTLTDITEAGKLTMKAFKKDGSEAGSGIYPIAYDADEASFNKAEGSGYAPIKWADMDNTASYTYTAVFEPTAKPAATYHEKDILGGVSVDPAATTTPFATPWGTRPAITLKHLMAKFVVNLTCTDGTYTAEAINAATITVKRQAAYGSYTITSTGITLNTTAASTTNIVTLAKTDDATGTATPATFSAILCPEQTLMNNPDDASDVLTLTITPTGGVAKKYTLKQSVRLVAGQTYTLTAKLSAASLMPGTITVTPWTNASGSGDLVIQ